MTLSYKQPASIVIIILGHTSYTRDFEITYMASNQTTTLFIELVRHILKKNKHVNNLG